MLAGAEKTGTDQQDDSTREEAPQNARLPVPPGPSPLWDPGIPHEWTDVRGGFVKPPNSHTEWRTRKRGAFEVRREEVGFSLEDQTNHCETWLHLNHVSTPLVERERQLSRNVGLREDHQCRTRVCRAGFSSQRSVNNMEMEEPLWVFTERPLASLVEMTLCT